MRRLKILTWGPGNSYLNALGQLDHEWYLPVKPGRPPGYEGRGSFDLPASFREIPGERVKEEELDLVVYQTARNYFEDQYTLLDPQQRRLPRIYLEHNVPRPHAVDTIHPLAPVADPALLLVHVTQYNRLMWDCGQVPTMVIEHSVALAPAPPASGEQARGITVINGLPTRGRLAGCDLFLAARRQVPLDLVGMGSEELGGMGDIPYAALPALLGRYRFLFSPMRYTSLPLAVIEAMTVGLPVVALPTTELPRVIEPGKTGYLASEPGELVAAMRYLLGHRAVARRMGERARQVAQQRFGLDRFVRDWNLAFERATEAQRAVDRYFAPPAMLESARAVG